jgi:uncharacterized membrane protein
MSGSGVSAGLRKGPRPGVRSSPWAMGWLEFSTLALCVLGLADSAYQTYTHYSGTGLLGCSVNGDPCQVVQHSPEAYVFGVPVAVFGVVFYVFMVAICSPRALRVTAPAAGRIRLAAAVAGMGFVVYLIYAELVEIGEICPYCTSVHIITFLVFTLILFQTALRPKESERVLECRLDVAAEGDEPFLAARRADELQRGGQSGRTAGHGQGQGGQSGQVDRQGQHGERYAPLAD